MVKLSIHTNERQIDITELEFNDTVTWIELLQMFVDACKGLGYEMSELEGYQFDMSNEFETKLRNALEE